MRPINAYPPGVGVRVRSADEPQGGARRSELAEVPLKNGKPIDM
jgi:hypothetical protein